MGQRLQRVDVLVLDAERHLAGRQDAQLRAASSSDLDQRAPPGRRRARSCRAAATVPAPASRSGRAPRRPARAGSRRPPAPGRPRRRRRRAAPARHHPAPRAGDRPRSRAGSCPRRRADHRDQPVLVQADGERCEVLGPADERARPRRQVARHTDRTRRRAGVERRALLQHLLLERPQVGARVDAELIDQQPPHPRVRRQGVGLAPGPVERGDQRRPEPLAQRMLARPVPRARPTTSAPAPSSTRAAIAASTRPSRTSSSRARCASAQSSRVDEDLAPEQGQTLARTLQGDRRRRPSRARRQPASRALSLASASTDCWGYDERVAVTGADDEVLVAECATQLRDLRLQRVLARRPGPEVLDQRVGAHPGARVESQAHQELGGLTRRQVHAYAVPVDLDLAEHPDCQHSSTLWRPT